ncbi:hypothetical protein N8I77_008657 [Diaporthe amygdali]|uniref:Uncharacterized protein n=1 Tax=Phomopsis amygdali TaxID=1214568 RepID=A0AAD9S821_PHOAM|nr:uncharacterized protein J7T55_005098 [Diaporthe amygdali]KAJ0116152.1 hypothetical protein J7T55_005098 [Diaporthe amygdali]KAK2602096.1 hypothetical protein N8I77_008657 [Diaporthe amygdali]
MKSFAATATTLLALASSAAANTWTLYCGDSCSDGTAIETGANFTGAACTNLTSEYEYCYFTADKAWYYAVAFQESDCVVSSDAPRTVLSPGECTDSGAFESYIVVVDV